MKLGNIMVILIGLFAAVFMAGCCSPSGTFATTEEHTENLGASIQNIFLDGDGIN